MAEQVICYCGPVVSLRDARERGLTRYFTGNPCKHGHVSEYLVSNRCCYGCMVERKSRVDPQRLASYTKNWQLRNPDKNREIHRKGQMRRYYANIALAREKSRISTRRLKAAKQGRMSGRPRPLVCEACFQTGKIVFDHCHATGRFRGWICEGCNVALGMVKECPQRLRRLIEYMERVNVEINYQDTERAAG